MTHHSIVKLLLNEHYKQNKKKIHYCYDKPTAVCVFVCVYTALHVHVVTSSVLILCH